MYQLDDLTDNLLAWAEVLKHLSPLDPTFDVISQTSKALREATQSPLVMHHLSYHHFGSIGSEDENPASNFHKLRLDYFISKLTPLLAQLNPAPAALHEDVELLKRWEASHQLRPETRVHPDILEAYQRVITGQPKPRQIQRLQSPIFTAGRFQPISSAPNSPIMRSASSGAISPVSFESGNRSTSAATPK